MVAVAKDSGEADRLTGKRISNVVPNPGELLQLMLPPRLCRMSAEIDSPKPECVAPFNVAMGENIRFSRSLDIPGPVSEIEIAIALALS